MTAAAKSALLFVGVDGGGTGCRARIEDAERSLLGSGIAGPAALRVGVGRAFAEVEKACCAAAEDAAWRRRAPPCTPRSGLRCRPQGLLEQLARHPHPFRSVTIFTTRPSPASARTADATAASSSSEREASACCWRTRVQDQRLWFPISDEAAPTSGARDPLALRAYDERAVGTSSRVT
jgi:glucosamine kinase